MKVEDQSLNEIEFEFSGHLSTLLAGLDRMRAKTQLTDVTLKTENRTFHVSDRKMTPLSSLNTEMTNRITQKSSGMVWMSLFNTIKYTGAGVSLN